jgi:hypothetical protein
MSNPSFEEFKGYVEKHHKRVGLRMLYKKFDTPDSDKEKFRKMWDLLETEKNASEKQSTETPDGDGGTPAGEVVCEEPVCFINVEEPVA